MDLKDREPRLWRQKSSPTSAASDRETHVFRFSPAFSPLHFSNQRCCSLKQRRPFRDSPAPPAALHLEDIT
eukprot:scaffold327_cov257-Pinguiococcus_pyrenoidosus.AAC.38